MACMYSNKYFTLRVSRGLNSGSLKPHNLRGAVCIPYLERDRFSGTNQILGGNIYYHTSSNREISDRMRDI